MAKLIFTDVPTDNSAYNWHVGSDFPNVPLTKISLDTDTDAGALAYVFFGYVNIDCDGGPQAYGPAGLDAHDYLSNAGDANNGWYGVASRAPNDPLVQDGTIQIDTNAPMYQGKYPVVQQAKNGDPNPGFYVSSTPHPSGPDYLQSSYIDASQVAFGALSGKFESLGGVKLGDYALAIRHDQYLQSAFYFVDRGGKTSYGLGECSEKVATNLGAVRSGPRFNNNFPVSFIVFPASGSDSNAQQVVAEADIQKAVRDCLGTLVSFDNPSDLALLMALNETAPQHRPGGAAGLTSYQGQTNPTAPRHLSNVLGGLQDFGLTVKIAANSSQDGNASGAAAGAGGGGDASGDTTGGDTDQGTGD